MHKYGYKIVSELCLFLKRREDAISSLDFSRKGRIFRRRPDTQVHWHRIEYYAEYFDEKYTASSFARIALTFWFIFNKPRIWWIVNRLLQIAKQEGKSWRWSIQDDLERSWRDAYISYSSYEYPLAKNKYHDLVIAFRERRNLLSKLLLIDCYLAALNKLLEIFIREYPCEKRRVLFNRKRNMTEKCSLSFKTYCLYTA